MWDYKPAVSDVTTGPEFDAFAGALRQVEQLAAPLAERAIGDILEELKTIMSPYPAQPDRDRANPGNKPSPYNTYVRGIGQFPRSSFKNVGGEWQRKKRGAYKAGPRGGTVHRTSQQLGKRWRIRVRGSSKGVEGVLSNSAGYAGVVLGHKSAGSSDGIRQQADFHAKTGWPNVDDSIAAVLPKRDQIADQLIDEIINQLAGS